MPVLPVFSVVRLFFDIYLFGIDFFDVNITFGNRSTRRIDPRTPEGPDP